MHCRNSPKILRQHLPNLQQRDNLHCKIDSREGKELKINLRVCQNKTPRTEPELKQDIDFELYPSENRYFQECIPVRFSTFKICIPVRVSTFRKCIPIGILEELYPTDRQRHQEVYANESQPLQELYPSESQYLQ
eukprot:g21322.t1